MFGRATRHVGRLAMIGLVVLGFGLAATPRPAAAELYTVEEVVDYMVPFLDQYWATAFADYGIAYYSPVAIRYYNTPELPGAVMSGCGALQTQNAFYCWNDYAIYLDYQWFDSLLWSYGDFAVAAVVAHEWGHHMEQVIGMHYTQFQSIQLELYADCLAGAATNALEWYGSLEPGDLEEAYNLALTIGDPIGTDPSSGGAHGATDQRITAFMGGYAWGDPAGCGPTVDAVIAGVTVEI